MDFHVLGATLKKNITVMTRAYPTEFFVGTLLTGVYTVLSAWFMYHILFQGNIKNSFYNITGTSDYVSYVIVGNLCYMFVTRTCLNVSRSLIEELREGTLESLLIAPFRRTEYFVGNMLVQTITTFGETLISIFIGILFGLHFGNVNFFALLVVFLVSLYCFFGMALVLANIMLYTRDTYISQNTLFAFILLLCGVTFPTEMLPHWLGILSELIPVTHVLKITRGVLLSGYEIRDIAQRLLISFLLGSAYIIIGLSLNRKIESITLEKMEG